jgi:hypothetical protein
VIARALSFVALGALSAGLSTAASPPVTEVLYLSGKGKDDPVAWEFRCSGERNCGQWTTIPVPSNWQLQGFGRYEYGVEKRRDPTQQLWNRGRPAGDEAWYRRSFRVPEHWRGRQVHLVFEGVMTDTEVWVNGESAGPVHQGGFYPFSFPVGHLVRFSGPNLLEVRVAEESADRSVNRAERRGDYWIFGGIYRPVYLEALPPEAVAHVAIDARHDGALRVQVEVARPRRADRIVARVRDLEGAAVGPPVGALLAAGQEEILLEGRIPSPRAWSAEHPHLHVLEIELVAGDQIVHRTSRRFGFRTVEVRPGEGLFVNGRRERLKGINRHSFWPDSGRTTSVEVSRLDADLIRGMNLNAVRTAHYPPDRHFLEAADEVGLYVINELAGWHGAYRTGVGRRLLAAMVRRDVNHPSVIFWANGNEGGWNRRLTAAFTRNDLQERPVLLPGAGRSFRGIDTRHYPTYDELARRIAGREPGQRLRELAGRPRALMMPTEALHALYDGGGGAGLADYWELVRRAPTGAGLFIWAFLDEAVVRTDLEGAMDGRGNLAPDGVVGPYREPEGSVRALRELFAPIQLLEPALPWRSFRGRLVVRNDFVATDLADCRFEWRLVRFPAPEEAIPTDRELAGGTLLHRPAAPGRTVRLPFPADVDWLQADALILTAFDPAGREVIRWSLAVPPQEGPATEDGPAGARSAGLLEPAGGSAPSGPLALSTAGREASFDPVTGALTGLRREGREMPLLGPRLVAPGAPTAMRAAVSLRSFEEGGIQGLDVQWPGPLKSALWSLLPDGTLELSYEIELGGSPEYLGVAFDFPEERVRGARWLGRGPYRVWRNRMAGAELGVWASRRNDTVTGVSWDYPEFPGYYADVRWARLDTVEGPLQLTLAEPRRFLQLLAPPLWPDPLEAHPAFPPSGLGVLHQISAIGTKFHPPHELGPGSHAAEQEGLHRGTIRLSIPEP